MESIMESNDGALKWSQRHYKMKMVSRDAQEVPSAESKLTPGAARPRRSAARTGTRPARCPPRRGMRARPCGAGARDSAFRLSLYGVYSAVYHLFASNDSGS